MAAARLPAATPPSPTPHILYEDATQALFLLDLPSSIAAAQAPRCATGHATTRPILLSTPPRTLPFPAPPPPRQAAARARLAQQQRRALTPAAPHTQRLKAALAHLHAVHSGPWCLPRSYGSGNDSDSDTAAAAAALAEPHLVATPPNGPPTPLSVPAHLATAAQLAQHLVANPDTEQTAQLVIGDASSSGAAAVYRVPPGAHFCAAALSPATAPLVLAALPAVDLVLLDPPWWNRSARRAGPYALAEGPRGSADALAGLVPLLAACLAEDAAAAIWITHARRVRRQAVEALAAWGMEVVEEWVWAKVTAEGELVVPLGGDGDGDGGDESGEGGGADMAWRRGWEVLLVGRRKPGESGAAAAEAEAEAAAVPAPAPDPDGVVRRVIVAVPDRHSRKPCLRTLLERLVLGGRRDAVVLEVFARHLTAGWWALGDEVLKFNWEGHWAPDG